MAIEFKLREKTTENKRVDNPIKKEVTEVEAKLLNLLREGADAEKYIELSKSYKKAQKYDKAIKNLNKAREISSFNPEIYYELGINHMLMEEADFARKNFIRSIRLDDDNLKAQLQLAISHELIGEDFMAIDIYKTIIEKNPTYVMAYSHLAGLYMELNMFEEGAKLFHQILNIQPDYYRANLGLGLCLDKMEKYNLAIRFYKKYITKKPNSKTSRSLAGRIYELCSKIKLKDRNGLRLIEKI